jgi:hypothetical protein
MDALAKKTEEGDDEALDIFANTTLDTKLDILFELMIKSGQNRKNQDL